MLNDFTKGILNDEIKKCMDIFRGNKGGCSFNNSSSCNNCGAVSLLHKIIHGVVDHRPIKELYPEVKIKKEKKTIEYVESIKVLLDLYHISSFNDLVDNIMKDEDILIKEGKYSKTYLLIEELLENTDELTDCIFIMFNKEDIDKWMDRGEGTPTQFLKRIKTVIDDNTRVLCHMPAGCEGDIGVLPRYTTTSE